MPIRYPITGYAITNALGATTDRVRDGLLAARSGLRPSTLDLPFETFTGRIDDAVLRPLLAEEADTRQQAVARATVAQLLPTIERAIARWGADRVALVIGTSTGGIGRSEEAIGAYYATGTLPASYDCLRQHAFYATTEVLARETGIAGPRFVVSTACTSSAKVFASGRRLLDAGIADAVLVGGIDSLCRFTLMGFHSLQVLGSEPCRPFSAERAGINIGEGGALLLLERTPDPAGDAPARAYLLGVGETSDAYHMTTPHPDGRGAIAAMTQAVADAALTAADVDHVNGHATATRINDTTEAAAIATVFGNDVSVVSTKGYTGHLLGACGATELAFAVVALESGIVPASLGSDPVDPAVRVRVETEPRAIAPQVVASNSFAFGGNNICVLLGHADRFGATP